MRKLVVMVFAFALTIRVNAQKEDKGVNFEERMSWNDIKRKAKEENKYIFVDAFATWCGPCKAMEAEIFPQPSVGEIINANFVSVAVQMDRTEKDDESVRTWYDDAKAISKESNITAYPTLLFYSPDGKLVHKVIGFKDANALIAEAKDAMDSSKQYFVKLENYKKGRLQANAVRDLAIQAKQMGDFDIADKIAQYYIQKLTRKEIYAKPNLEFISKFITGSKDKNFAIFLKNGNKVNKIAGKNFAENVVMSVAAKEEIKPYDEEENPDWKTIENRMIAKYGTLGEERVWGHMMVYYLLKQDWSNFGNFFNKYFERAIPNERSFVNINSMSWQVFLNLSDTAVLQLAIKAMEYQMKRSDIKSPNEIDTYANLLYKTGNTAEAIEWEEKAIKLSNGEQEFVETLNKMKRGEATWPVAADSEKRAGQ